jgi:serine/threonine-protein kinase RsbW
MARTIQRELTVPSDTRYLAKVRQAVMETLGNSALPPVKANLVALAVDEAMANIIEHAYNRQPSEGSAVSEDITVELRLTPQRFEIIIRDRGPSFDPRVVPPVDLREHVRAGNKGGLGIFLIRRIMDEVNYSYRDDRLNELRLVKYIDGQPEGTTNRACVPGSVRGAAGEG